MEIKTHRERPIPPSALRGLYEHVGWFRPASDHDLAEVLEAAPAVGAWDDQRLAGFVRALSYGHLAAYVEDVMVHAAYRGGGVGEKVLARLLEGVGRVANVSLFLRASRGCVLREGRLPKDLLRAHAARRRAAGGRLTS